MTVKGEVERERVVRVSVREEMAGFTKDTSGPSIGSDSGNSFMNIPLYLFAI